MSRKLAVVKYYLSDIWPKCSIFDQTFDFLPRFRVVTKISILDKNFDIGQKIDFNKTSIFADKNFDH